MSETSAADHAYADVRGGSHFGLACRDCGVGAVATAVAGVTVGFGTAVLWVIVVAAGFGAVTAGRTG